MGIATFPVASGGGPTSENRNYKATTAGTKTIDLPAGAWQAQSSGLSQAMTIGGQSWDGTSRMLYFDSPQTSMTFSVGTVGTNWYSKTSNTTEFLRDAVYGANTWVVVGDNNTMRVSSDGATWTTRSVGFRGFRGTFQNNMFLFGTSTTTVGTSTDSVTWTLRTVSFSDIWFDIAFGAGVYCMAGRNSGTNTAAIAYSTDLITWTQPTTPFGATIARAITFGNGLFVAGDDGGRIITSTNGTTWTSRTSNITQVVNEIIYGERFVAVADTGALTTSTDGITWVSRTSGFGTSSILGIGYGNNLYVAVGAGFTLRTSTDTVTWTLRSTGFTTGSIHAVGFGNNLFVAVGSNGQINTSPDAFPTTYIALEYRGPITNV